MFRKKYDGRYAGKNNDNIVINKKISFKIEDRKVENFASVEKNVIPAQNGITEKIVETKIPINVEHEKNYYVSHSAADYLSFVIDFIKSYSIPIIIVSIVSIILFTGFLIVSYNKVKSLASYRPDTITRIFDKNGKLISELFQQKREVVAFDKIPQDLVNAFVAMEDNEFYDHHGINPKGIVRAFFVNIISGKIKQGGSTITQQLAKIMLTSGKRNIFRKINEAFIALMIEKIYTKDEILLMYLNQLFMGHGTYGVQSAAKFYFSKNVWELNKAECALLSTLPSAPNIYSPIKNPKISMGLHRIALSRMVDLGFLSIADAEKVYLDYWPKYLQIINEIPPSTNTWTKRIDYAPWVTETIRRQIVKKYGEDMVYNKGLKVYTTIDIDKQTMAQQMLTDKLNEQSKISSQLSFTNSDFIIDNYYDTISLVSYMFDIHNFSKKGSIEAKKFNENFKQDFLDTFEFLNYMYGTNAIDNMLNEYKLAFLEILENENVEGALVTIDHNNGYIEAMVGGSDFTTTNQLNRVTQSMRQAGSSIKPLLYAAAIESKKFTAATGVLDAPVLYLDFEGGSWTPENYEEGYSGFVRLRKALAKSINVISVRIAETIGVDTVISYYAKFYNLTEAEAKQRIPRNFSIAIGTMEVTPLEQTRAYAIIANGGKAVVPYFIRYIVDYNGVEMENPEKDILKKIEKMKQDNTYQIIQPETAEVMISLLKTVVDAGTGGSARIGRSVAGKTGTTNNWKDAWFVGFTPEYTTGIWMGYDAQGRTLGKGQTGGSIVAPLWGKYMRYILRNTPSSDFPKYADLITANVCEITGKKPSANCIGVVSEVFIPGTLPEEECAICSGTGSIQIKNMPDNNVVQDQKSDISDTIQNMKPDKNILDDINKDLIK